MPVAFDTHRQEDLAETVAQRMPAGIDHELIASPTAIVRHWALDFTFEPARARKAMR